MKPEWAMVLIMLAGLVISIVGQALYIPYQVGKANGRYTQQVTSLERIFVDKCAEQAKEIGDLRDTLEKHIGKIAYIEGRINGRNT